MRPPPLRLIEIPQIERRQPLPQSHDWAGLLGFSKLSDGVARELADVVALMRTTPSLVVGLTRQREAAELKRCAKKLRRERRTGRPNIDIRLRLADPRLGFRTETFARLGPLTAAPTPELLAAVEARRREVEREPRINPQTEARKSAGGGALWFFLVHAAESVRDEPRAWWCFVLAALDEAGFPTEKLYEHPESLRPLLDELRAVARPPADKIRGWLASGGTAEALEALLALAEQTLPGG